MADTYLYPIFYRGGSRLKLVEARVHHGTYNNIHLVTIIIITGWYKSYGAGTAAVGRK